MEYHAMEKWDKTSVLLRYAAGKGFKAYSYAEIWGTSIARTRPAIAYVMCDGVAWPVNSTADIDEAAEI